MRFRNSFWPRLGREEAEPTQLVIGRVREAMLFALDEYVSQNKRAIEVRVVVAYDLDELWFLRTEIMYAIAASRGETLARECLTQITSLFIGHYPGASPSRFGAL
jgi:hypothetical protein